MKKTINFFVILVALLLMTMPVMADTVVEPVEPIEIQTEISVDSDGGRFQVGFVNVEFKKRFLDDSVLPTIFNAEIYAENGEVFIEFSPDTILFYKKVHLRIEEFSGYIYDRATGENVYVEIDKQQILAPHFSRYCIFD